MELTEKIIIRHEDSSIEITQSEKHRENMWKKWIELQDLWNNNKRSNIHVIWVSEEKEYSANKGTKTKINGETYHIRRLEESNNKDIKTSPGWSTDLTQYQSNS